MTSIDTWSPWVSIFVAGGWIILAFASAAYSLYLSRCHLDSIKEALKNSRYIYLWGPSLGRRGLIWSLFEISRIAGMVLWPKTYIRLGDVNPVDLDSFPPHLKRHLIVNTTLMLTSCLWMAVVAILLQFR
jgi:hypothetical protein